LIRISGVKDVGVEDAVWVIWQIMPNTICWGCLLKPKGEDSLPYLSSCLGSKILYNYLN